MLTGASKAFNYLKQGVALGKDISEMSSQVSTFMRNTSDIENFEKRAKNPTLIQSIFNKGNVEQVAIDSFMAKKKLQKQRQELRNMIMMSYGEAGWQDFIKEEATIRKNKAEFEHKRIEQRDKLINYCAIFLLVCTIIGFIVFLAYLYKIKN